MKLSDSLFKNIASLVAVVSFFLVAVASKVNKLQCASFHSAVINSGVQSHSENFVEKRDGTKIVGTTIDIKTGMLSKNEVVIDGQKINGSEVKGIQKNGRYFAFFHSVVVKRIIEGKLSVFVYESLEKPTSSAVSSSKLISMCTFYVRREGEEVKPVSDQNDIKNEVADCPLAYAMADLSGAKIRKAIKENPEYLDEIFYTYNNGCKASK